MLQKKCSEKKKQLGLICLYNATLKLSFYIFSMLNLYQSEIESSKYPLVKYEMYLNNTWFITYLQMLKYKKRKQSVKAKQQILTIWLKSVVHLTPCWTYAGSETAQEGCVQSPACVW